MQLVCMCGYVPAVCLAAMVWICLGNRHTPLVENTHRHTRCPPLWGLHHVGGMFAERILCADRSPRNRPVYKSCLTYTHRVSASIAKSLASNYKARLVREEGLLGEYKAPSVTQTAAVSGYLKEVAKPPRNSVSGKQRVPGQQNN